MTETEYKAQQAQDTNQVKKAFDAGYQKGRQEGIEAAYVRAQEIIEYMDAGNEEIDRALSELEEKAERLKEAAK